MVRIGMCTACQLGEHKGHHRVIEAAPEGVLGGVICECKGGCDSRPPKSVQRLVGAMMRAVSDKAAETP